MKLVIEKGYTLEVTSWENDGDSYQTNNRVFETKEEALAYKHMCNELMVSKNRYKGGIGNMMEDEYNEGQVKFYKYLVTNPTLLVLNGFIEDEAALEKEIIESKLDAESWVEENTGKLDGWYDRIFCTSQELMGYSEYYFCRVCESCSLYYSEKDIYLEEIK